MIVGMMKDYTAIVERDGEWFIAYCAEVPEANGQGKTREEAIESLLEAIELVRDDAREEALANRSPSSELVRIPA